MNCGHFSDSLNSSLETKLSDMKIDYVDCYSTFYLKEGYVMSCSLKSELYLKKFLVSCCPKKISY